jgi:hypothetical protein
LLAFMASRNRPIFAESYLLAALPAFVLFIAVGCGASSSSDSHNDKTKINLVAKLLGLVFLVLSIVGLREYFIRTWWPPPGWRSRVQQMLNQNAALPPNQTRFVFNLPDPAFYYYYPYPHDDDQDPWPGHMMLPARPNDFESAVLVARMWAHSGVRRVVVHSFPSKDWDPQRVVERAFAQFFTPIYVDGADPNEWRMTTFVRTAIDDLQPTSVHFGERLELAAARVLASADGRALQIDLHWQAGAQALRGGEKFFVHVVRTDDIHTQVAQLDRPITREDFGVVRSFGLRLPNQLPAGKYWLKLGVYDSAQPSLPRMLLPDGADFVIVGSVNVR